jgi:hypothetical protein
VKGRDPGPVDPGIWWPGDVGDCCGAFGLPREEASRIEAVR